MADILIAGCGDVGTVLGLRLVAQGHRVWGLKRNIASLPAELHGIAADLSQAHTLNDLPAVSYVVYCAAAGGFSADLYQAAYVTGVANLLTVLQAAKQSLQRFLFVSSTSVYGQDQGQWVDESAAAEADGFSAQALRDGENLAWSGPFPATVVRFAGIYGPGRTRLLDTVRAGTASCQKELYTNRIHRDDCAGVLQHLLQLERAEALYIGVDDQPATQYEVVTWLAAQLGVSTVFSDTPDKRIRSRANKRCSNKRLHDAGYQFCYPGYKDGYTALLAQSG